MDLLGGIAGILGGLFGGGGSSSQSFEKHSTTKTDATTTDLSPDLLKQLEDLFKSSVGSGNFQTSSNALVDRIKQLSTAAQKPEFDVAGFAKGVTDQASAAAGLDLESAINGLLSKSGVTESGNSMNALLANKLRNQTTANIAGVNAQATATGEGIRSSQSNTLTQGIQNLSATLSQQILQLIQGTRGATATGTSTSKEDTVGKGTTTEKSNPFDAIANAFGSLNSAKLGA